MEAKDFIIGPAWILLIIMIAFLIRPMVTDQNTRVYFIPALVLKILGAVAIGLIYQYYYSGGDTYNFFTYGSKHIWDAFLDHPYKGFKLIFGPSGVFEPETYQYASKIWFYRDPSSYLVIRFSGFFGLFTFHTYTANAALFAAFSFSGLWALFNTFYRIVPHRHLALAISVLFVPSVFFWGSGILKDSITIGALGWATFAFYQGFILRRKVLLNMVILLLFSFLIFSIKKYILLCFLPALLIWFFLENISKVKSVVAKSLISPPVMIIAGVLAYNAMILVGEGDRRYSVDNLAQTAKITAYDIRYWTGKDAGSGYTLGDLDGSFESMIILAPAAINVSLFRPYLWEVNNPLMLISSIESMMFLFLTLFVILRNGPVNIFRNSFQPVVLFCLIFALTFAFAVGVSTFNFGTLARYKIPLIPYFLTALVLIHHYSKRERKLPELDETE